VYRAILNWTATANSKYCSVIGRLLQAGKQVENIKIAVFNWKREIVEK
jgi:hypothetical protein